MTKNKEIFKELSQGLTAIKNYNGDLSDVGNEVGILIAKYLDDELGYDLEGFIAGVRHGVSLMDGTHG